MSIKIVLIDSGIDVTIHNLAHIVTEQKGYEFSQSTRIICNTAKPVIFEHGTALALIMYQLCKNIKIISMNIFNEKFRSDGRILLHSFKEALSYKPHIIHLSVGTNRWRYRFSLSRLVRKAFQNNIFVVTAMSNDGKKSYPALLKNVIPVKGLSDTFYRSDFSYENNMFFAPLSMVNIEGMNELKNNNMKGNSIAAAYVTGHLANILLKHNDYISKNIFHELITGNRERINNQENM